MGARTRLNGAALNGALVVGGLVALVSGNLTAGVVVSAIMAVIGVLSGDIRFSGRK